MLRNSYSLFKRGSKKNRNGDFGECLIIQLIKLKQKILYSKDKAYKRKRDLIPKELCTKKTLDNLIKGPISQKCEVIMEKICTKDVSNIPPHYKWQVSPINNAPETDLIGKFK